MRNSLRTNYLFYDDKLYIYIYIYIRVYIQRVTGGTDQTSGGCSLCETISKKTKTPISKVERFGR